MDGARNIESLVRAIRSTGPRELLLKLAVHREELQQQLHAVLIQTVFRGYLGRKRVKMLRRRFAMFQRVTEQVSTLMLEEFVIQTGLDLAINFHRVNDRYHRLKESLELGIMLEMESIVMEIVQEESLKVTETLLLAAADSLVALRKRQLLQRQLDSVPLYRDYMGESKNPLIMTLVSLLVEESRSVVIEAVLEETKVHLINAHTQRIAPQILDEVITIDVLRLLLDEFALVEEQGLLGKAVKMIEEREVAQLVLCDRAQRTFQRQRQRLRDDFYPRSLSPEQRVVREGNFVKEDVRNAVAANLVTEQVSEAMLQTLLRSHDAQFNDSHHHQLLSSNKPLLAFVPPSNNSGYDNTISSDNAAAEEKSKDMKDMKNSSSPRPPSSSLLSTANILSPRRVPSDNSLRISLASKDTSSSNKGGESAVDKLRRLTSSVRSNNLDDTDGSRRNPALTSVTIDEDDDS